MKMIFPCHHRSFCLRRQQKQAQEAFGKSHQHLALMDPSRLSSYQFRSVNVHTCGASPGIYPRDLT